ncbi:MAG: hypothetical protein CMJ51_06735 [Planctomycetaceae bacterium]|nr:hypothetical protein [Planctomycetaceae bacterium]
MHQPTKVTYGVDPWPSAVRARLLLVLLVAAVILTVISGCSDRSGSTESTTGTPASRLLTATESAGLPPLPPSRAEVYDYYRLGFFEDGYPGRRTADGLVPHPIYGTYVILDYLNLFKKTNDPTFLKAASHVADAAMARMDTKDEMLRFYYEPEWGLGSSGERFVSGLTQAHYLDVLSRFQEVSGDPRYAEACTKILRSLATPVEEGGVLALTPNGPVIEEAPHTPRDLVLNGWLSALRSLRRYINRTDSEDAKTLLASNLETLASLLPLYDAPDVLNSRYRIRGYGYIRITLGDHEGVHLERPVLEIPGDANYPLSDDLETRWHMGFVRGIEREGDRFTATSNRIQMNVVMSLLSMPEPNVLRIPIDSPRKTTLVAEIADGPFDPLLSGRRTTRWNRIAEIAVEPGLNQVEIELGFDEISPFVYPTNFLKKIGGRNYNSYHFLHIKLLESLCAEHGIETFCDFSERWRGYVEKWPAHPAYRDADIELHRYEQSLHHAAMP